MRRLPAGGIMPVLLILAAAAAGYAGYVWWRKENPTAALILTGTSPQRRQGPGGLQRRRGAGTGAESDGPDPVDEDTCGCHPRGRIGGRRR